MENVYVVVGQHRQGKFQHEIDYDVICIILHPRYQAQGSHTFDIALYITKTPIKYSKHARPVCLSETPKDYDGIEMTVSGWGRLNGTNFGKPAGSVSLQAAQVRGIDWDECKKAYPKKLKSHMICAVGTEIDDKKLANSCEGDDGGNGHLIVGSTL